MSQFARVAYTVPTIADAKELAENMRAADRAEIAASHGLKPLNLVAAAVDASALVMAARIDGNLIGIWGVVDLGGGAGTPWLLTTRFVDRYPILFWKLSRLEICRLFERWHTLVNFIDVRHNQAIRWAERLGLPLEPPAPFGICGKLFRRFVYCKGIVNVCTSSHRDRSHRSLCGATGQSATWRG